MCVILCMHLLRAQTQVSMDSTLAHTLKINPHRRDISDILFPNSQSNPKRLKSNDKIYFSLFPASVVPRGGDASLSPLNNIFFLGERKNTSSSSITFTPYPEFDGRYVLPIRSSIWLKKNSWNIRSDIRFLIYPQDTWGLGGNTKESAKMYVHYNYIHFNHAALKKVGRYLFIGPGYDLNNHFHIRTDGDTLTKFTGYSAGTGTSSFSSGITLNLLYDARKNIVNPVSGFYGNIVYRNSARLLGSDDNWQSLFMDARKYFSFSKTNQNVLAFWAYYWTILSGNAPYFDLPATAWDPYTNSSRGFQQSRYRGKGLLYVETEYRRDLTHDGLLGYVLFANIQSVTEPVANKFTYWHMGTGVGLRIKVNKLTNTNFDIDYAMSKNFSGFYLNFGEIF